MTTTEPTDPRKLAQDALELAEKATEGKWAAEPSIYASGDSGRFVINRLPSSHLDEVLIAEMPYSAVRGKDARENIANAKLMAASRQLVPDFAKALIAALDEVERLQTAIDRFQATEGIIIGKRYFEKVKLPIPISAAVNVEGDLRSGEFVCSTSYNDGPPAEGIDYTKDGRSFTCNYCSRTLSTRYGIEEHVKNDCA